MKRPKVTVLITAYNAEDFIRDAVDSILNQSYKDFELMIINDGSTDHTMNILEEYKDKRIRIISRENKGRAYSLNEGVHLAEGDYIAIMDADDISLPDRLKSEIEYLESNHSCAVVASFVELIDENGIILTPWEADRKYVSVAEISNIMPYENCIANPSVMVRAKILKSHSYNAYFIEEDYDLWLRLLAEGYEIHKIDKVLVKYRIREGSLTQASSITLKRKVIAFKYKFLLSRTKSMRFGPVEYRVFRSLIWEALRTGPDLKRMLALPLILYERTNFRHKVHIFSSARKQVLFTVPWLTMGGAEKVVLELVRGLSRKYDVHIIITEKTVDSKWVHKFQEAVNIADLAKEVHYPANKVPYIEKYVKANRIDIFIISNSFDGYRAIPGIKRKTPSIRVIDILHGQGGKIDKGSSPTFSQPYHKLIDRRVTVTDYLRDYMHKEFGLPRSDFTFIPNGAALTENFSSKGGVFKEQLRIPASTKIIGWLGRFNDEKKPFLGLEVARRTLLRSTEKMAFVFAGDGPQKEQMEDFIEREGLHGKVLLPGSLEDPELLLADSYALMMTSEMEGMPLAILEANAAGVPVVATRVGGIPEIVKDAVNGYLIDFDDKAPDNFTSAIMKLAQDESLRKNLGKGSKQIAENFTVSGMVGKYLKLLEEVSE